MKIFEPKPPPTSGAMTRSLCSCATPTKAEHEAGDMRVLACCVQRVDAAPFVVFAESGAGLHRIRDQAVVGQIELDDLVCLGESGFGFGLAAEFPFGKQVLRGASGWTAARPSTGRRRERWQRGVFRNRHRSFRRRRAHRPAFRRRPLRRDRRHNAPCRGRGSGAGRPSSARRPSR